MRKDNGDRRAESRHGDLSDDKGDNQAYRNGHNINPQRDQSPPIRCPVFPDIHKPDHEIERKDHVHRNKQKAVVICAGLVNTKDPPGEEIYDDQA